MRNPAGELFGLSNNHVTGGSNYAMPGLPIVAPGIYDVAPGAKDPETLGHHSKAFPFVDGLPEVVDAASNIDAAIFKIRDADRVTSMQRDKWDTPSRVIRLQEKMRVAKVGRTTGYTVGEVIAVSAGPEPVKYVLDVIGGKKIVFFDEIFFIRTTGADFAQSGDFLAR